MSGNGVDTVNKHVNLFQSNVYSADYHSMEWSLWNKSKWIHLSGKQQPLCNLLTVSEAHRQRQEVELEQLEKRRLYSYPIKITQKHINISL